jgi:hypothetical protein
VAHTYSFNTWETEVGGWQVQSQPGVHSENLAKKKEGKERRKEEQKDGRKEKGRKERKEGRKERKSQMW